MQRRRFLQGLGVSGVLAATSCSFLRAETASGGKSDQKNYSVAVSSTVLKSDGFQIGALVYYPSDVQEKLPLVVYSHGLGASPYHFAYLGCTWASRGVVTVILHHPETDESQWRGRPMGLSILRSLYNRYWAARDRALAIRAAIDALCELSPESAPFASILDHSRIGVSGNDLGALGAMLVAGQLPPDDGESLLDTRVSAVAALSPIVYCDKTKASGIYGAVSVPFLSVSGTYDDGIVGPTRAWQRRIPFDALTLNDRYHALLNGGDHLVYSGHIMPIKQINDAPYQEAIRTVTTLFWTAYLRNETKSFEILKKHPCSAFSSLMTLEYRSAGSAEIASR